MINGTSFQSSNFLVLYNTLQKVELDIDWWILILLTDYYILKVKQPKIMCNFFEYCYY